MAAEEVRATGGPRTAARLIHQPTCEAAANRAWQAAVIVAHDLVAMLAVDVAAGNRRRLRERVATAVEEDIAAAADGAAGQRLAQLASSGEVPRVRG